MLKNLHRVLDWIFHPNAPVVRRMAGDILVMEFGNGGTLTLNVNVDLTKISKADRDFINEIIDKMQKRSTTRT